jgi:hypothetical protein
VGLQRINALIKCNMSAETSHSFSPPQLNNQFICIVDRGYPKLAAVILSYLAGEGRYCAFFEMPGGTGRDNDFFIEDEHTFSRSRTREAAIIINNAIAAMGGIENVILVGLSDDPKSYLKDIIYPISIDDFPDVHYTLSSFFNEKPI